VIIIAGFVLGAAIGAFTARQRGGKPLDMLQYAAGYGIAFLLLGLFATILIDRMAR
jgi:F0F1-type ATP synthase assembly protein I